MPSPAATASNKSNQDENSSNINNSMIAMEEATSNDQIQPKQQQEQGSQHEQEQAEQTEGKSGWYGKAAVGLVLVAFIVFVVADSLTNGYVGSAISAFLEWIEDNPVAGFFVFMVVYFFATVFFVPGSILTLGAGFVFANAFNLGVGVLLGSLSVFVGASAGAIASFLLGRFLLRDWVSGLTKKYTIFEALDVAFEEKGFRIMALLRLSPIIPFNAINYIAGVTAVSFWSYVWAMFAILPGTVLYVFLGASAGSLADSASSGSNSTVTLVVVIVGVVFGIIAVAVTSYYAKTELNRIVEQRQAELGEAGKDADQASSDSNVDIEANTAGETESP